MLVWEYATVVIRHYSYHTMGYELWVGRTICPVTKTYPAEQHEWEIHNLIVHLGTLGWEDTAESSDIIRLKRS
jgi:hypothetical protein